MLKSQMLFLFALALILAVFCRKTTDAFVVGRMRMRAGRMSIGAVEEGVDGGESAAPMPKKKRWDEASEFPMFSDDWAGERGLQQGYGGIWPGNPDAKKFKVTIKSKDGSQEYTTEVPADRYIYFAFEELGIDLPVCNKARMCRQGCCTVCTVKLDEGKVKMDAPLGLLKEMRDDGYALSCCSYPRSDIVCTLQDEDEMYIKQWAEGFEGGGTEWGGFLPEDD